MTRSIAVKLDEGARPRRTSSRPAADDVADEEDARRDSLHVGDPCTRCRPGPPGDAGEGGSRKDLATGHAIAIGSPCPRHPPASGSRCAARRCSVASRGAVSHGAQADDAREAVIPRSTRWKLDSRRPRRGFLPRRSGRLSPSPMRRTALASTPGRSTGIPGPRPARIRRCAGRALVVSDSSRRSTSRGRSGVTWRRNRQLPRRNTTAWIRARMYDRITANSRRN